MLKSVFYVTWFLWIQLAQISFQFLCRKLFSRLMQRCMSYSEVVLSTPKEFAIPYQSHLIQDKRIQLATRNWVACSTPQPQHQWFVLLSTLVSMLLYHGILMFFPQNTLFTFLVDVLQNHSEDILLLVLCPRRPPPSPPPPLLLLLLSSSPPSPPPPRLPLWACTKYILGL